MAQRCSRRSNNGSIMKKGDITGNLSAKGSANRKKAVHAKGKKPSASNRKQKKRKWLDLPYDVMANILKRIDIVDILENAQKVCTTWYKIYKNPSMWRVICMNTWPRSALNLSVTKMCKDVVDRSQGQLVDITLGYAYNPKLLMYVADRSSQLRRLELASGIICGKLATNALIKFPLLEELNLYSITISKEDIKTIGRYCPMLKTLKANRRARILKRRVIAAESLIFSSNDIAIAIGKNLPELRHLELVGNNMKNVGLQVILNNCNHLETLDLRDWCFIDLKGDLGKQCSEQINHLKLPNDSLEGYPYICGTYTLLIHGDYYYLSQPFIYNLGL